MEYYYIRNGDDGLQVGGPFDREPLLESLFEDYDEIDDKYKPVFVDKVPQDFSDSNEILVIRGEVVIPRRRVVKTAWTI